MCMACRKLCPVPAEGRTMPHRLKWSFLILASMCACWSVFVQLAPAVNEAVEARMRKDITFLASDECEGRGVTTKGINLAADYIAGEFKAAGLKPAGMDGTYIQPFSISGAAKLGSANTLVLHGPQGQKISLRAGTDFQIAGLSAPGKLTAPILFLGYGASAKSYDDYRGVDPANKLVVILRRT